MLLRKIAGIKNVGRFKAARISGGEYGRYTLIYGGNGRGKSTLCSILRSLQQNDPKPILRRKTFQATAASEVTLLLDTGPAKFSGGAWSAFYSDLHIFDQQFVRENVYSGDQIEVEHRRNFYRVVVGPEGVALAGEVDRLDAEATAKQAEVSTAKKVVEQHLPASMKLDAFLKLPADTNIDTKITAAAKEVKAVNDVTAILARKLLVAPKLPDVPSDFANLLAKGVDGIAADAAARVQAQVARHDFHDGGEAWLSKWCIR